METPDRLDASQLARLHAGDVSFFTLLVQRHSPRLLGVATRLTEDIGRAEDLLQDTWLQAFRHRTAFTGGSLLAWLLVLLRRQHLQQLRSTQRRAQREEAFARDLVASATDTAVALAPDRGLDDDIERVLAVLERLAPRQRDVLVERVLRERSTAETALTLGIAEGTVKSTLAQALHRLRLLLADPSI